jgi:Ca2+-binding RTX toxin-like protein
MANFSGGSGDDKIKGSIFHDSFDMRQGGEDTVVGGSGSDFFDFGGALDAGDFIDAGPGGDAVLLEGDYSGGLTLDPTHIKGVESFSLLDGFDYHLTLADGFLKAGKLVEFFSLGSLTLDASASHAGDQLRVTALGPVDLIGGAGAESLVVGLDAGAARADLGAGDDDASIAGIDLPDVQLEGGDGLDTLTLRQTFDAVTLEGGHVHGFETVLLSGASPYYLTVADSAVDGGAFSVIMVDSGAANWIDLSGVTTAVTIVGGGYDDSLLGGRGADHIAGGGGYDVIVGGGGADVIDISDGDGSSVAYLSLSDSKKKTPDLVQIGDGYIDLSEIDANTHVGGDQDFVQVAHFGHHAGEVTVAYKAKAGLTYISLDVDGEGKADAVITLQGDHHDFSNFVL